MVNATYYGRVGRATLGFQRNRYLYMYA